MDPVGYLEMVWMEAHCRLIATDSGGVQKEAYFFNKPCITMRDETEWVELVESGWLTLVGANDQAIQRALVRSAVAMDVVHAGPLYGAGDAGQKIVAMLAYE
jgi:UDP-GlcNAc3NAcA epimerase